MSSIQCELARVVTWSMRLLSDAAGGSIPRLRRGAGERQAPRVPRGLEWERLSAGSVPVEWIGEPGAPRDRVLLYLHGGGMILGLYNRYRQGVGYFTRPFGVRALLPDYRLAPEHPFPAGPDDCITAYRWLLEQGYAPQNIVIGGDSAGGQFTLATLMALRDAGDPLPAAAFCICPASDATLSGETHRTNARRDALLSPKFIRLAVNAYVGSADPKHPLISPLFGDPRGLPPLLIHAGEYELLLSDATRFADRAREAGVDVRLSVYPRMWHVWHAWAAIMPEARQAVDEIGAFIRQHIGMENPVENRVHGSGVEHAPAV